VILFAYSMISVLLFCIFHDFCDVVLQIPWHLCYCFAHSMTSKLFCFVYSMTSLPLFAYSMTFVLLFCRNTPDSRGDMFSNRLWYVLRWKRIVSLCCSSGVVSFI
jgi:hypothetical protein